MTKIDDSAKIRLQLLSKYPTLRDVKTPACEIDNIIKTVRRALDLSEDVRYPESIRVSEIMYRTLTLTIMHTTNTKTLEENIKDLDIRDGNHITNNIQEYLISDQHSPTGQSYKAYLSEILTTLTKTPIIQPAATAQPTRVRSANKPMPREDILKLAEATVVAKIEERAAAGALKMDDINRIRGDYGLAERDSKLTKAFYDTLVAQYGEQKPKVTPAKVITGRTEEQAKLHQHRHGRRNG